MKSSVTRIIVFLLPLTLLVMGQPLRAQGAKVEEVSRFSGKPLPRFESLRYSAVHGRQGPTLDHPILWRYERKGLPMLILRETYGWRRVRDVDGDEVWVQSRMLSEARTVFFLDSEKIYRKPDLQSAAIAKASSGLVAELHHCELDWCRVTVQRKTGWVRRPALWGTQVSTGRA